MAQPNLIGGIDLNFIYRNRAGLADSDATPLTTPANYQSPATLDARLIAIDNTVYTAAYLDAMTLNDKIMAVRANDDPDSI